MYFDDSQINSSNEALLVQHSINSQQKAFPASPKTSDENRESKQSQDDLDLQRELLLGSHKTSTVPDSDKPELKKMGTFQTFIGMIKSYCAINLLLLPKAFANGGYALSVSAMILATFFEALCAFRLSTVARKYKVYSY